MYILFRYRMNNKKYHKCVCLHWNYILKCNAVWLLWYVNLKMKVQFKKWWKKPQPYSDALVTYYRNVGSWNWPKELHKWSKPFCFINLNMYLYKFYYYKWKRIWNHLCLFHVLRNKNQTSKQTKISIKIHNFKCFIINYKLFILTMWYSYNVEDFFVCCNHLFYLYQKTYLILQN